MKTSKKVRSLVLYTIYILTVIAISAPIMWMISQSLKNPSEQFATPPTLLVLRPTLENYIKAVQSVVLRCFINSFIVCSSTTIIAVIVSILAVYTFSRERFMGRKALLQLIVVTQLLPLISIIIPLYRIMRALHLLDTYGALVISFLTFTVPTAIWLLYGFIKTLPLDLEEAAQIDGCSKVGAFFRVTLPLLRPGITATAAYVFIVTWQEFLFSLTFISSPELKPLSVGILRFIGQLGLVDWGALMASSVLTTLPVFILFLALQRQIVSGLTSGALKR